MTEFDPVPLDYLLDAEQAELYIPQRFAEGGDARPHEVALQVLVDDSYVSASELRMFQLAAKRGLINVFRFMKSTLDAGAGRHTQHAVIAMCLYPDRTAYIDFQGAARWYLEKHHSLAEDVLANKAFIGSIAAKAMMNYEANVDLVQAGQVHIPS